MPLYHETLYEEGVAVVVVQGELVAENADELSSRLGELVGQGQQSFVIDLQQLEFMDSTGLSTFVKLHKQLNVVGGKVQLCCVQPDVQRIFELTRLDTVIDIVADRPAAIERAEQGRR